MATFSERFKELRIKNNHTQRSIAEIVNLEPSTIGKWEQKNVTPNDDTLFKLCEIFHCSLDYLLGRDTEELTNNNIETNTVTVIGRDSGKEEFKFSEEQLKIVKKFLKSISEDKE